MRFWRRTEQHFSSCSIPVRTSRPESAGSLDGVARNPDEQVRIQWGFGDAAHDKALLDRDSIIEQLRQLKKTYEFVVVVLPPLSQFAHAAAVAPTVDGVVAVGIYHRTSGT